MARRFRTISITMLLALILSACGQAGTTASTEGTTATPLDHGGMPMGSETATMDHSGMDHGGMETGGGPFDAQFIDSMIEHHRGAIAMAEQALKESQRPEIKQLAQNIISSQQQEIDQMTGWRTQWYPGVQPTGGMNMEMGDMELSTDTSVPFDQRFISSMVAHHQGAIAMAEEARTRAEHAEIKELAEAIITAQESEVQQLRSWDQQWFGG